ncbi:MAG: DUF6171 family protein [Ruminococcus sp.]|nr:DUF6171 family protein [Ruminococcus sp.]
MTNRPPCRKCLIDELDKDSFFDSLSEYISHYPKDKSCNEQEYKRRLEICKGCERLTDAMCELCGCFVELRALKKNGYCPDIKDRWRKG